MFLIPAISSSSAGIPAKKWSFTIRQSLNSDTPSCTELLLKGMSGGLTKAYGSETTKAINYYIDPIIALKDPALYCKLLEQIFGNEAIVLTKHMIDSVCELFSLNPKDTTSFESCMQAAKQKFLFEGIPPP